MLVNVKIALSAPAICGLNVTVNGALCPAGMMIGSDKPPIVNRELFVLAAVTVTFAPPVLRLAEAVSLVPSVTLPKSKLPPPRSKLPDCCCRLAGVLELNPWQPTRLASPRSSPTLPALRSFAPRAVRNHRIIIAHSKPHTNSFAIRVGLLCTKCGVQSRVRVDCGGS